MANLEFLELDTIEKKRQMLRSMSKAVTPLVQADQYHTINEAVIEQFYRDDTHSEFKTFHQWKADGYSIKKGAKAFLVWGRPKKAQDAEKAEATGKEQPTGDDDRGDFYPLAFLFSNAQVERRAGK